ncbi:MAG: thioredoxin-disulfide reductase, partial [Candidatus Omnitrophota bacterium]
RMKTNCEGIFACGDCTDILPRQVAVASGSAVVASFSAKEYVNKVKGMEYK